LPAVGRFSYRDHLISSGELEPGEGAQAVESSMTEAILSNVELEDLQARASILQQCAEDVEAIESALTNQVGVGNAASFQPLTDMLRKMHQILAEQLGTRGAPAVDDPAAEETVDEGAAAQVATVGEILSRDDANRMIDKICAYYEKNEPASPVPLLLQRAKRVAGLGFIELLRELAPGGLDEAQSVTGSSAEESDDE